MEWFIDEPGTCKVRITMRAPTISLPASRLLHGELKGDVDTTTTASDEDRYDRMPYCAVTARTTNFW